MKRIILLLTAVLVVGVGLRVLGAFQNEQQGALLRVTQAEEQAERDQQLADQDKIKLDCDKAWSRYQMNRLGVEHVRLAVGAVEFDKHYNKAEIEEIKASKTEPTCGYKLDLNESTRMIFEQSHYETESQAFKVLAALEKKYAADRRAQAYRIRHKVWTTLTGATIEPQDEWTKFLTKRYGRP
jgi:hypothetical protein